MSTTVTEIAKKYIVASLDAIAPDANEETVAWDFARAASAEKACEIVTDARRPIGRAVAAWTPDEFVSFAQGLACQVQAMNPAKIEESLQLSRDYVAGRMGSIA